MTFYAPRFRLLPVGSVRPLGWLRSQLRLQADGLTGHLDEFWPSVRDSRWIGGEAEGWERGPYWLDGLIPLAFALDDAHLKAKAQRWIDYILAHQHDDGWLGAREDEHEGEGLAQLDPWPLFVLFKALTQWQEATNDERIVPAMLRGARCIHRLLRDEPLRSWAKLRWADLVLSLQWLHEQTGDAQMLELAHLAHDQGFDWNAYFEDFRYTQKTNHEQLGEEIGLPLHGVNNAMAWKSGAVWWRHSGEQRDRDLTHQAIRVLDAFHGNAVGMFNADEHLAGLNPSQGFETCAVVEALFSLEVAGAIMGDVALFDRLEQIAFNALPGNITPDFWAHQYHGSSNQVLCDLAPRPWTDSGPKANLYGQDVHFGCCQANLHQGWPKFLNSLWMQTDDGIAATAFAPCRVQTEIDGAEISIEETTNYPFGETIEFKVEAAREVHFALHLRIPAWAKNATLEVEGKRQDVQAGSFARIERLCRGGTTNVKLRFPLHVRLEERHGGAISLHAGALTLALPIKEKWRALGSPYVELEPRAQEWEIAPQSPWNYALQLDTAKTQSLTIETGDIAAEPFGSQPFGSASFPLRVRVPGVRVLDWKLQRNVAAPLPQILPVATKKIRRIGAGALWMHALAHRRVSARRMIN